MTDAVSAGNISKFNNSNKSTSLNYSELLQKQPKALQAPVNRFFLWLFSGIKKALHAACRVLYEGV